MDDLQRLRFDRHFRTASSEGYHVMRESERIATVDLHFTLVDVRCTLILEKPMQREEIARLIERIDEDLVLSADTPREDLLVNVYQGTEVGFFSDEFRARGRLGRAAAEKLEAGEEHHRFDEHHAAHEHRRFAEQSPAAFG